MMHCVLGPAGRVTTATDDAGGCAHDRAVSNTGWRTCKRTRGQGHKVGARCTLGYHASTFVQI